MSFTFSYFQGFTPEEISFDNVFDKYFTIQKFGVGMIFFNVFERRLLSWLHLFDVKIGQNSNVKYYCNFKYLVFYYFKM